MPARRPGPTMPQASTPSSGSTITWPRSRSTRRFSLRGWMVPHIRIHGGCEHYRSGEREICRGEKIVGHAVGEFSEQVGGGGRHYQDLILLSHANVLDRARKSVFGAGGAEQIRDHFAPGERGESERTDELTSGSSHQHFWTENPRPISARASSAALYAAIPPPTPSATLVDPGMAAVYSSGGTVSGCAAL